MPQPDPLEQLLRYANPNPERIGCPGKDVLRALARKELSADHPAGHHLGECSPCFREFRDIQREEVVRHRFMLSAGLAACLLVVLAFFAKSSLFHRETPTSVASITLQKQTADLFEKDVLRGAEEANKQALPVSLPAAPLELRVILPRFSRPGTYQIAVCHDRNAESTVVKALGPSMTEGPRQTVTVILDLSKLPKGSYWLSTRYDDNEASDYFAMKLW